MAHCSMYFPMVLWEVQNAYSVKKQSSSTFSFLGENWKLHFILSSATRGQFIQVFLKRIEPYKKIICSLGTRTSLISKDETPKHEIQVYIDTSSANQWCVWDEDTSKIRSYVGSSSLTFLCVIQPYSGWKKFLRENVDKGMKLSKVNPDIDSLHEDLRNMFDKHIEADVVFKCKGEELYAHRAMISSRCKVLAAMFQTDMKESREGVIDITDTEPIILRVFLRYLYTGDLPPLPLNSTVKLYFLADKYGMDILKKNCVFFMMDSLEVDASKGTSESNNEENLGTKIQSRLRSIREVLNTDNWEHMNEEQLKMFLDAFHTLIKDIYNELGTGQETVTTLLNQDVQIKKIKLME